MSLIPAIDASDCERRASRLLEARPPEVYAAFTDPGHLARWWRPEGFRNSFQQFEPWPGGIWRYVMHGPDGSHYPNESRFVELLPAQRIVLRHLSGPPFDLSIDLEAHEGRTCIVWCQRFQSAADCARIARYVAVPSEQHLNRLAALLADSL
ncbi:MAG: polyketide cyclase [Nevskiaceae bacterium]|nr:MAG: polyketide cyclase [Nevskiaceae bacterium]TAM28958.1 MAG: polyketide cyclase [Nevskiaceae bacterium]